jgi:competence protein ComEC
VNDTLLRWYPHLLAAALCAGLAAANVVRGAAGFVAVLAVGLALAAGVVSPTARVVLLALALTVAGWWWASARLERLDDSLLAAHVGETARADVVVTGPARRGAFALRIPAEVRRFGRLELTEPILLLLPLGRAPPQGAVLELTARLARPRPSESGFDEEAWLRHRGVAVVAHGSNWRAVGRRGGLESLADKLRSHLEKTIAPGVEGERAAVIAGIVLGADHGLSEELRDAFRASGLYHLLAVSGQNVAFIALGVLGAAWLAGIPRWLGEIAVLASIGGYVLAVGWEPSVVRAGVAGAVASLAWLTARPRDRWYVLLLGAIVLLAWNPYSVHEPGFQLSFAAVGAIFVLVPRLQRLLEGYPLPRVAATVVAVSAACAVVTAPLLWLHFRSIPVYSVPANALGALVMGPLLGLGLLASALEPLLPVAAAALAWINGWLAAYLAACARLVAALPGAQVSSATGLGVLVAVALLAFAVARLGERTRRGVLIATAAALAALGAWTLVPRPSPPLSGLRITFLDVGQGDAVLVQVQQGAILVDQGPPEARVARQLVRLGVRRLAMLVMTHPSRDHNGGAEEVIRRLRVDLVLHADVPFDDPFGRPVLAEARRRGIPVRVARSGQRYRLGGLRVAVLWPRDERKRSDDANDHALVLLVSYGSVDALLPADAEANVTAPLRLGHVELLKVGHHGSSDPRLDELLDCLRPDVSVISVGARNGYGHPAPSTLAALADRRFYRTDENGRVTVDADGSALRVTTER